MTIRAVSLGILALAGVIGVAITSCSKGEKRAFLSVGTAPPGGAFFVVGGAIAEVLDGVGEENGWQVTAESTMGSRENISRLAKGELDLAMSNAAITYFAVRGEGQWDQPQPVRSVMTLAPNVALFVTTEQSGLTSIAELKGKRVVIGPAGAGFESFVGPILEAHGVSFDDLTALNSTQAGAVDMLADGSAAAVFIGGAVPTASITQASASQDLVFLPFEKSAREALIRNYAFFHPATIPAETYRDQAADFHGLNVGSMHLITAVDQSEDEVYRMTKALYENRDRVVEKHPAGKAINPKNVVRDVGTDFHPGAIRYYEEIGIWPQDGAPAE